VATARGRLEASPPRDSRRLPPLTASVGKGLLPRLARNAVECVSRRDGCCTRRSPPPPPPSPLGRPSQATVGPQPAVGPPPPALGDPSLPPVPPVPDVAPTAPLDLLSTLLCDNCGAPHTVHSLSHDAAPVELGHTGSDGAAGPGGEGRPATPLVVIDDEEEASGEGTTAAGGIAAPPPAPPLPPLFNVNTSILRYTLAAVPDPDADSADAGEQGHDHDGGVTALSLTRSEVAHADAFLAQQGWTAERLSAVLAGGSSQGGEAGEAGPTRPDEVTVAGSRRIPTCAIVYDDAMLLHEEVVRRARCGMGGGGARVAASRNTPPAGPVEDGHACSGGRRDGHPAAHLVPPPGAARPAARHRPAPRRRG
jgi:hypothetical protein